MPHESDLDDAMARHPAGNEKVEPDEIRDADDFDPTTKDPDAMRAASYWRKLVEARATIARVEALVIGSKNSDLTSARSIREALGHFKVALR